MKSHHTKHQTGEVALDGSMCKVKVVSTEIHRGSTPESAVCLSSTLSVQLLVSLSMLRIRSGRFEMILSNHGSVVHLASAKPQMDKLSKRLVNT